jgi:hypothetical protein
MTAPSKSKKKPVVKAKEIELDPDAWPKFEALVKSAAKMGHKPHMSKKAKPRKRR